MRGQRYGNALLVLGMHRSGTSLLTGTLEQLGVHLGTVRVQSPYNRKGNRERLDVQRFHNRLLEKNSASWHAPPQGQCRWDESDRAEVRALLAGLARPDRPWGFKDPRTIFTVHGWMELLEAPRMVAIVRPCEAVARSLSLRGAASLEPAHGRALWLAYNRELLRLVRRYRIPVLPFPDTEKRFGQFSSLLAGLCSDWGLESPERSDFYEPALVHHGDTPLADDEEADGLLRALLGEGLQAADSEGASPRDKEVNARYE